MNKKGLSLIKFSGQIQPTPAGTRIIGQVGYTRGALLDILVPFIFSIGFMLFLIWGFLLARPIPYGAIIIVLAMLLSIIGAFFMPLYRLSRIPYSLLNDDDISSPIPLIWVKPEWAKREKKSWFSNIPFLKQENLFYTRIPIEKCAELLHQDKPTSRYLTQWGTGDSTQVNHLTVVTYQQSDEQTRFIIKGADKRKHGRFGQAQSVGTLIAREHDTLVKWVVYNRMAERVFFALITILVLIGLSIIINNIVMLPISLFIMGLFYLSVIHEPLRIARYPRQILGK